MVSSNGIAVAFRVDGSADIGMGHVVRCLSLASQVRGRVTSRIYFMMRNYDAAVDKVVEEGYTVLTLPRDLERLDEIRQMDEMVERKSVSVLVLDTPDADRNLVAPFREKKLKVAVIDDLGGRAFGADLLINGSAVERFTTYPPRAADKMLIGPRYMIVREDFHLQSLLEKRISRTVNSILVTLGGADLHRTVFSAIEGLDGIKGRFDIVVVLGKAFVDASGFESYLRGKKQRYTVLHDADNLANLMYRADLAVVSGGMTLYELVCTHTPGVVICMDEHQVEEARAFEKRGAVTNLGLWREATSAVIAGRVGELIDDYGKRVHLHGNCRNVTDGRGASRVVKELFDR